MGWVTNTSTTEGEGWTVLRGGEDDAERRGGRTNVGSVSSRNVWTEIGRRCRLDVRCVLMMYAFPSACRIACIGSIPYVLFLEGKIDCRGKYSHLDHSLLYISYLNHGLPTTHWN